MREKNTLKLLHEAKRHHLLRMGQFLYQAIADLHAFGVGYWKIFVIPLMVSSFLEFLCPTKSCMAGFAFVVAVTSSVVTN